MVHQQVIRDTRSFVSLEAEVDRNEDEESDYDDDIGE
jgi:hypothetical protein